MASQRARPRAPPFIDPPGYARHRPEATLLYQLVERYYPEFVAVREADGRPLPRYVQDEFEAYLKCGRLEHGFLRVRCEDCHAFIIPIRVCDGVCLIRRSALGADPNTRSLLRWPAFDAQRRATMVFDATSAAADDPLREQRIAMFAAKGLAG